MESADAKLSRAKGHLETLYSEAAVCFKATKRNFVFKTNGHEA
jgi:hypothetical protein